MDAVELRKILDKHKLWLEGERGGERADLRHADIDFSCLPLWCGGLKMHIDDKQAIQILYHLLSSIRYSKNVSEENKKLLLTDEIMELANKFHRIDECGRIKNGCSRIYES